MEMLKNMNILETPTGDSLTAEECRRSYRLGKKLFSAFLISESLDPQQILEFHTFLTLIESLEKSIRAGFDSRGDICSLTLLALVKVEALLEDYTSPIIELFREDLTNLKITIEHHLGELN